MLGDAGQPLPGVVVAAGAGQEEGDGGGPRPSEGEGLEGGLDLGHRLVGTPLQRHPVALVAVRPGSPWCRPPARPGPGRRAWPTGRRRSGPRAWPAWPSRRPRHGGRGGRRWRWPGRRRRRCPRRPATGGPARGGRRSATSSPRGPGRSSSVARAMSTIWLLAWSRSSRSSGPHGRLWRARRAARRPVVRRLAGRGRRRPPTGRRSSPWRRRSGSGSAHSSLRSSGMGGDDGGGDGSSSTGGRGRVAGGVGRRRRAAGSGSRRRGRRPASAVGGGVGLGAAVRSGAGPPEPSGLGLAPDGRPPCSGDSAGATWTRRPVSGGRPGGAGTISAGRAAEGSRPWPRTVDLDVGPSGARLGDRFRPGRRRRSGGGRHLPLGGHLGRRAAAGAWAASAASTGARRRPAARPWAGAWPAGARA